MWLLMVFSAWAGKREYMLGDANVGVGTSYGQGRLDTAGLGMNFNVEAMAGAISKEMLPTSVFFHTRIDFDVSGIYDLNSSALDLGMDWRINLHTGLQFFGCLPVNFAMKDARFGFYRDAFVSHGLYGVGLLLPKEYFVQLKKNTWALNASLNIGARVRSDFSSSPAGVQPEILFMNPDYSGRISLLQTFGSQEAHEFSITGMMARKNLLIKGSQFGVQWRYAKWNDVPTQLDEQQFELMLFMGGNPKWDF